MYDDEPELAGYEPGDGRPLRSPMLVHTMRIVVVVGLIGLILPGIITTLAVANESAQANCKRWVRYSAPTSPGAAARFDVMGSAGPGWYCYTSGAFGGDKVLGPLGIIPGPPHIPAGTAT